MKSSSILDKLTTLFRHTTRMIHYLEIEDVDYVFHIESTMMVNVEKIIETRCGSTVSAVHNLLSFEHKNNIEILNPPNTNFDKQYAYTIRLRGFTDKLDIYGNPKETQTGHIFILIHIEGEWRIIDSYFNERTLTIRDVNIKQLDLQLKLLQDKFDVNLWNVVTLSNNIVDIEPVKMKMDVVEYLYDRIKIDESFKKIVEQSLDRLDTIDGQSDEYVAFLSKDADIQSAKTYLKGLLENKLLV